MKVLADSGILAATDLFSQIGDITVMPGREIRRETLGDAEILLVRSITAVDAALLDGSKVCMVGSATSGLDHIDTEYLQSAGIKLFHARGANADAVVDYCLSAMSYAVMEKGLDIMQSCVGIIGGGAVGKKLQQRLHALGISCLVNDPPLAAQSSQTNEYVSLEEALQCDVVSLHVPLTNAGDFPTRDLLSSNNLELLAENCLLIHTCRGGVIDETALVRHLDTHKGVTSVVDVWANEPRVNPDLVNKVDIATPHIAGYSTNAKAMASFMLFDQIMRELADTPGAMGVDSDTSVALEVGDNPWAAPLVALPLMDLSARFKAQIAKESAPTAFDELRQSLVQRVEFSQQAVRL